VLILFGALAVLRGLVSLFDSIRYKTKVDAALKQKHSPFSPNVTTIVPCKGVEPDFEENIEGILKQKYEKYSIIFVTSTHKDPAYLCLEKILSQSTSRNAKLVIAPMTQNCSQKIQNLLQGVQEVGEDTEVLVFADSDIRPHENWLRDLVAPLQDKKTGASTGYRWYMPIKGNLWSAVRSVWNMTSANLLFHDTYNFAWGGSMAIPKEVFERLKIAPKWQNGLSDDMIFTQAVKRGGYKIKFVPQCLVASFEKTTWPSLLEWTSRQMTIVRIYDPKLWKLAALPQWFFNAIFVLGLILVLKGLLFKTAIPLAAWLMLSDLPLGAVINSIRFSSFKNAMPHYRKQMAPYWWAYVGLHLLSSFVMSLSLIKSAFSNRITWRGIRYEMRSPEETVVFNSQT
jgi:cellulose synthase/poly-beta-1,6-N-acetylglucosamine synthase-like glycosyltransferase